MAIVKMSHKPTVLIIPADTHLSFGRLCVSDVKHLTAPPCIQDNAYEDNQDNAMNARHLTFSVLEDNYPLMFLPIQRVSRLLAHLHTLQSQ